MFINFEVTKTVMSKLDEYQKEFGGDTVVTETDKYEGTEYETIVFALVTTKGLKKEEYHFNSTDEEPALWKQYVAYYRKLGRVGIEIHVCPITGSISVYEVGYGYKNEPVFTKIEELELPSRLNYNNKRLMEYVTAPTQMEDN